MGNTYGDAWINILYDMDTEVRITDPSEEVMKVHNIKPTRYLVLPGTDKKFPEGVFVGVKDIHWGPKTVKKPGSPFPKYERMELKECQAGQIYPVTLFTTIISVDKELERMGIPRVDSSNQLTFQPGELEKRLSSAKKEFLAKLETSGLKPEEEKVYYRLVGNNPFF
jgi:hypothetical protein